MTPSRCMNLNDSQRTPLGKRSPQEIRSFAWETAVFPCWRRAWTRTKADFSRNRAPLGQPATLWSRRLCV